MVLSGDLPGGSCGKKVNAMKEMTQTERLNYLVEDFKEDPVRYRDLETPEDVEGRNVFVKLHVLYLEIGIGMNTPVICKYPFWQMTNDNPKAVYACLNFNEAYCPVQIEKQSICIDGDCAEVIEQIL